MWFLSSAVSSILCVRLEREEYGQRLFRIQMDGYNDDENDDNNNVNNDDNNINYSNCNKSGNDDNIEYDKKDDVHKELI